MLAFFSNKEKLKRLITISLHQAALVPRNSCECQVILELQNGRMDFKRYRSSTAKAQKDNDKAEGSSYCFVDIADHSLRNFHGAIENHKEHLNLSKVAGDREGEGRAYSNLGIAYRCLCNCQRAVVYQKQHMSIAKVVGDGAEEGGAHGNLGHVYQCP